MFVRVGSEVMVIPDESFDKLFVIRIPVKISREEKRSLYVSICERIQYLLSSFIVIVSRKDQINKRLTRIHSDDRTGWIGNCTGPALLSQIFVLGAATSCP